MGVETGSKIFRTLKSRHICIYHCIAHCCYFVIHVDKEAQLLLRVFFTNAKKPVHYRHSYSAQFFFLRTGNLTVSDFGPVT